MADIAVVLVVIVVLSAAGCGGSSESETAEAGAPRVVATTAVWAEVVDHVACGQVDIEALIPAGSDPHGFEPSLYDRATTEQASLVVANGLNLEEGLGDMLDAATQDGAVLFVVAEQPGIGGGFDASDSQVGPDPHIWLDPTLVAAALDPLADRLIAATDVMAAAGLGPAEVRGCAEAYRAEIEALDTEIESLLEAIAPEQRSLVTSHDALGYFADRYGLDIVGSVVPSTSALAETGPAHLAELASLMGERSVGVIFTDRDAMDDDAWALADRLVGVEVVPVPLAGLGAPGGVSGTYIDMMRELATLVAEGLSR